MSGRHYALLCSSLGLCLRIMTKYYIKLLFYFRNHVWETLYSVVFLPSAGAMSPHLRGPGTSGQQWACWEGGEGWIPTVKLPADSQQREKRWLIHTVEYRIQRSGKFCGEKHSLLLLCCYKMKKPILYTKKVYNKYNIYFYFNCMNCIRLKYRNCMS